MSKEIQTINLDDLDAVKKLVEGADADLKTLRNDHVALREEVTKFAKGVITEVELDDRMKKINASMDGLIAEVETIKNAKTVLAERPLFHDYRALLRGVNFMNHDDGRPYEDVDYRAHALFYSKVDYSNMRNGAQLIALRDLHDACYAIIEMKKFMNDRRWRLDNSPLWKEFIRLTAEFDAVVAHAMATTTSGYGAEWQPTEMSAQFGEYLRVQPSLMNKIPFWMMGKGVSGYYPFQSGRAVAYKGAQATTNNPANAKKTDIGTDRKLFSPVVCIAYLLMPEEATEDTIIDMIGFVRSELTQELLLKGESGIINGDTTATHMDNAAATQWDQTYAYETAFKGIRRLSYDATAYGTWLDSESYSTTTGVGSLEIAAFLQAKQALGVFATRPKECLWVTGLKGKIAIQKALYKEDALGILQYITTGLLPDIDGTPVYISGEYLEDQESDGFGDSAAGTDKHTSITLMHCPSFRIGQKRGVTLEMGKFISTQNREFAATARWDFGKVCATLLQPVATLINVQHTA